MSNIDEAIAIAKTMKKPIIHVTPEYILGTDNDFFTLSIIHTSSDIPRPFTCILKDLVTPKDKEIPDTSKYSVLDDGYLINTWMEPELQNNIMVLFSHLGSIININPFIYPKIIDNLDISKDERFRRAVGMKDADGHMWYTENSVFMSSFARLHAVNAADSVYLTIYDVDPMSYLSEFMIVKKKCTIYEYIKYRKLN